MGDFALLAPELLLLVGVFWALFAERLPGKDVGAAWAGVIVSVGAAALAALQPLGLEAFGGLLYFDARSRFVRVAIALLSAVWLLWLAGRGAADDRRREAVAMGLFASMGTMLVAESAELITLFISIEFAAIPAYVLVGYHVRDGLSLEGALKYFLLSILTTLVMLYGFSYLYGLTGTTMISDIDLSTSGSVGLVAAVLALTGLLAKMSAAPFHYWAPDAYEGARPWAVAFASTVPKLGGAVALVRLAAPMQAGVGSLEVVLLAAAAASMLLGNLAALPQDDVRRMMAYSGVGHAGYLLLGVVAATSAGADAAVFYAVAYAVPSLAIMLLAEESGLRVADWGQLSLRRPAAAWASLVLLLSLVGIPPLIGFFGKLYLFSSALAEQLWWPVLLAVVMSVVSAGYYLRIVRSAFFGDPVPEAVGPAPSVSANVAHALLLAATVLLGVAAGPLLGWITGA